MTRLALSFAIFASLPLAAPLHAQPARPAMPDDIVLEPDLIYSNVGGKMALDIVRPRASVAPNAAPRAAVLCIHGGGFRAGKKESYLPLCIRLAQRGYVAATVEYRLAPRDQFPAQVHDVKAAVRFLRANAAKYGIDPDRIGVTGQSAGGTLALFVGLTAGVPELEGFGPNPDQSSRVSCVANFYGATDFTKSYGKSVDAADVLPLFLGGDLEHEPLAHRRSSPLNWVNPSAAPVLSLHGTKDRYVEYAQSVWLTDRLKSVGVVAELETLEGADHGFKGAKEADLKHADERMFAWFEKFLSEPKEDRKILVSNHGPGAEVMELSWPSGKVLWRVPNEHGHDVQGLAEGHVLYTMGAAHKVIEMDRDRKRVWEYGAKEGLDHPIAAQRLANGNTLIGDAKLGKVIEVTREGKMVWQYASPDLANMRLRICHRTNAGTTLIAVEAAGKIIEVDAAGRIVWTYEAEGGPKRLPYQARRLANGNTLVSLADPGEIVEVDRAGKIVRSIGGTKMDLRLAWVSGVQELPNGSLLVSDYTGKRLLEIDSAGKVVHEMKTDPWGIASVSLAMP